ncbi:hypothetical protein IAR55_002830 [Kwoniella newhampshirensis]|uniref:Nuclear envelope-endoplasmic reticulum network protein n=1 Tax=Kwoniella newhampshirensis TaxID=1651941 RepID=A0AAW0YST0_9TREE
MSPALPSSPLHLPISPSSPSLHAQISTLTSLSLQLSLLSTITSPVPARIPLTSKASFPAQIINPDRTRVHLGAEWWVDMSAEEASDYVRRRKERILEDHARMMEGRPRSGSDDGASTKKEVVDEKKAISFHPLLYSPAEAGPSGYQATPREKERSSETKSVRTDSAPIKQAEAKKPVASETLVQAQPKSNTPLLDVIAQSAPTASSAPPHGGGDDTTLNEEGLPFHEIRETIDGETIGPLPPSTPLADAQIRETTEEKDDYWSEEAVARRATLRRRLFHEGDNSDEEEDADEGVTVGKSNDEPESQIPPSISTSQNTDTAQLKAEKDKQPLSGPSSLSQRPSLSNPPPSKSILKPTRPPTRKKSVSFDPAIPSSPSSPDTSSPFHMARKFGFPLPLGPNDDTEIQMGGDGFDYAPRPVPMIAKPDPVKKGVELRGFAGFKRGFLSGPPKVVPEKDHAQAVSVSPTTTSPTSTQGSTSATETASAPSKVAEPKARKPSLFAQRLAQPEIDASAPTATGSSLRTMSLPKASQSKSTSTVRTSVVEKPLATMSANSSGISGSSKTPSSEEFRGSQSTIGILNTAEDQQDEDDDEDDEDEDDEDEDEDDDGDLGDFSSGEEDEYDLDDALLAREIALEYHKRRAYQPLNHDLDEGMLDSGEIDMGVMLGLPTTSIGTGSGDGKGPMIVNPTPDDLRRFVRVGRLENGNLVLAPGEEGGSSDSDDNEGEVGEEKRQRLKRREDIKRKLMGLDPIENQTGESEEVRKGKEKQENDWRSSLPPALLPAQEEKPPIPVESVPTSPTTSSTIAAPTPPKKVSRFKAARMAGGQ